MTDQIVPLILPNFTTRGTQVQDMAASIPAGTPVEHLLSGDFWAHCAPRMLLWCEIRCMWEDGTKYARVLCTHTNGRHSRFVILELHELEKLADIPLAIADDLDAVMKGPKKWCIQDKKTGQILKEMIPTQAEAVKEMNDIRVARAR